MTVRWLLLFLAAATVATCGQKGPLVLPEKHATPLVAASFERIAEIA